MLRQHPTADNAPPIHLGPRKGRVSEKLDNISQERSRAQEGNLSCRLTKFSTNYTGQVRIPTNLVSPDRDSNGDEADSQRCIDVGQVPED